MTLTTEHFGTPQIFTRTHHIRDQAFELYVLGQLSEADTAAVEQHVTHCGQCQYNLNDFRKFFAIVRSPLPYEISGSSVGTV